ncbi:hypothetical protein B0T14DRAFT_552169 [Immersiella caudata]|uniref:Uncharacterized protein n=1 Tax=Immersiella caudata TaxID=314043 RepID=A0AA39X4J6_9PEZI|nr:hypothetical protein B0T14DRAFT_552169 [Immersiella caudata]
MAPLQQLSGLLGIQLTPVARWSGFCHATWTLSRRVEADGEQVNGGQADDELADEEQADEEQADEEQADGEQVDNEQADEEQADGEQVDNEQADEEQPDQEQPDNEQADGEQVNDEQADQEQADNEEADGEQVDNEQADEEQADGEHTDKQVNGAPSSSLGPLADIVDSNAAELLAADALGSVGVWEYLQQTPVATPDITEWQNFDSLYNQLHSSHQSKGFALIRVPEPALGDYPENARPRISSSYQQTLEWRTATAAKVTYKKVDDEPSTWEVEPFSAGVDRSANWNVGRTRFLPTGFGSRHSQVCGEIVPHQAAIFGSTV